jgi:bacterioferritin-associated ferredoxin
MKPVFSILGCDMDGGTGLSADACSWRRAMTCCECVELAFDEVARRVREDGVSLEDVMDRTGCGRLCTACLPDLRAHLTRRR